MPYLTPSPIIDIITIISLFSIIVIKPIIGDTLDSMTLIASRKIQPMKDVNYLKTIVTTSSLVASIAHYHDALIVLWNI